MKSKEHQEAVTARVQAMFDNKTDRKQDAFAKLKPYKGDWRKAPISVEVFGDPADQGNYIKALYEFFNINPKAKTISPVTYLDPGEPVPEMTDEELENLPDDEAEKIANAVGGWISLPRLRNFIVGE